MRVLTYLTVIFLALGRVSPATAQATPGRADLAALTIAAPVVLRAGITSASRLSEELAPGVAPGFRRFLVKAEVRNVLIAPGFVPREIEYLVDLKTDSRGRAPKLKGFDALLFLEPGRTEMQFRLARPWAQIGWTAERETYVRARAAEVLEPGARAFAVTGLRQAFHVRGSIPGESESQIFVDTATGDPIALVVLARPGVDRQLSVATGDIIDEAAHGIEPGSLLWYHLACGLPPTLPESSTSTLDADDARAVREDYRWVLEKIGACDRVYSR